MDTQTAAGANNQPFKSILKSVNNDMQLCIQDCMLCHDMGEQMIVYCLDRGSVYAWPNHINLFRDCADICAMTADFLVRGSNYHSRLASVCAELCDACAKNCERMSDDEMMEMFGDILRRCAERCRKLGSYEH